MQIDGWVYLTSLKFSQVFSWRGVNRGVIHWTKIFGNSGTESNGTEIFKKIVSKVLVNLWRLSFFPEI